jgi:non-specific serine/threonine protein kinase
MSQITFGPFRLDRANRRLLRGAEVVPLRPKAFAVLEHLAHRPGQLVTKEQLLAAVWPDTAVTDTVLKVCVREIRDALGDEPESAQYIKTAHRFGYRFIGHVSSTNLPAAVSTLVGRQREIDEISGEVGRSRLVTLTGPGGSGKSRLAVAAAGVLRERFEHGVWWVDLGPLTDARFVPEAVAVALGVRDQPGESLTPLLGRFLATRAVLLVVDNCEHLIDAAASLVHSLLQRAAGLRVLTTSREPLGIEGERVWVVPPLSAPGPEVATAREALGYEAVQLFVDRATAAMPSFALSDDLCPSVGEICRRLDGMPLAIELAAARVRALSAQQIAGRLHDCFGVLGTTRRAELPRHQTLRATIDWSYDLLTAEERRVLQALSVFVDSFTPEAAEHVATVSRAANVLDAVGRLVDKSLIVVSERATEGEWRYRLLDTVRQYAHEKLLGGVQAAEVVRRHAAYYLNLAEAAEAGINTSDRVRWLEVLAREHSNLRAAIERTVSGGQFEHASRFTSALFWFWFHRGLWREGRTFLQAALAHETGGTAWRARVLLGDGVLAWAEGDHATAAVRLGECLTIDLAREDAPTKAHALHFLAMVRLAEGRAAAGRPLADHSVQIARTTQDAFCLTIALASQGVLLLAMGLHDEARKALEESVARGRQARDEWAVALPLRNLAIIASRRGDYEEARRLLQDSLRGLRDLGEKWFLSRSIETLAEVLAWQGEHQQAAVLFGSAEGLRDAVGASVLSFYRHDYDEAIARSRKALGAPAFERYWHAGRTLAPPAAVAYALGESHGSIEMA